MDKILIEISGEDGRNVTTVSVHSLAEAEAIYESLEDD